MHFLATIVCLLLREANNVNLKILKFKVNCTHLTKVMKETLKKQNKLNVTIDQQKK